MRNRLQLAACIGMLVLGAGCAAVEGVGRAAGLPQPQPRIFPQPHPPDAAIVARETVPRWEKKLDVALVKAAPAVAWPLFALAVFF